MTYRELLTALSKLTDEQLDCSVTVELEEQDEFYPVELYICGSWQGVLDDGHPVLVVPE